MKQREDVCRLNKQFAHRLAAMVHSRLITCNQFVPWADHLVETLHAPPNWILDLSGIKYYLDAVRTINEFVLSEPFEDMPSDVQSDEYIACLFLRYSRRELSWASFLELAGSRTDACAGREECEYFYTMLNDYEDSDFAESLEVKQRQDVQRVFADAIKSVKRTYEALRQFELKRRAEAEASPDHA